MAAGDEQEPCWEPRVSLAWTVVGCLIVAGVGVAIDRGWI